MHVVLSPDNEFHASVYALSKLLVHMFKAAWSTHKYKTSKNNVSKIPCYLIVAGNIICLVAFSEDLHILSTLCSRKQRSQNATSSLCGNTVQCWDMLRFLLCFFIRSFSLFCVSMHYVSWFLCPYALHCFALLRFALNCCASYHIHHHVHHIILVLALVSWKALRPQDSCARSKGSASFWWDSSFTSLIIF